MARVNVDILGISKPGISLEGMMLKLTLQYFGHFMQRVDSLEKTLMLGGIGAGEEGDDRGWDGWMASLTWWTWVWVNSRSWWWTGRPGVLRFMGLQRVRHDWATELNWTEADPVMTSTVNCQVSTTISSRRGFPFATFNYVTCSISKKDITLVLPWHWLATALWEHLLYTQLEVEYLPHLNLLNRIHTGSVNEHQVGSGVTRQLLNHRGCFFFLNHHEPLL